MTDSRTASRGDALVTAYRWLTVAFALLIVVQAWLGSQGAFANSDGLVTGHGHLANAMFLMIVLQTVLSWVLLNRRLVTWRDVGLNVALVALTVTQIGLGYSTRNGETWGTMVSLHIPNGVLLMAASTVVALFAWAAPGRTTAAR